MDPGKLRDKALWLRLAQKGADLAFEKHREVWVRVKETGRKNLFSRLGVGGAGVEILLRRQGLTLEDCLFYRGGYYFLTNLTGEGLHPVYDRLEGVRAPLHTVTAYRHRVARGPLGQALEEEERLWSFPGWVTEKYLSPKEEESHLETSARLVVVAPKAALFKEGDLFEVLGKVWRVMAVHSLEEHKNEYEIERREDD